MLLFTKPIARPAIWGGTLLREYFRYPDFPDPMTEKRCWRFGRKRRSCSAAAGSASR